MKKNLPITDKEVPVGEKDTIISATELSGAIKYSNQDFNRISGFDRDELYGKSHNIIRHPDMPQAAFKDLWDTLKNGDSWIGVVKNRCKNGDYYWVDAYATPISRNNEIYEYQSVRKQVDEEIVERAEKVYQALNDDKPVPKLKHPPFSLRTHLFFAICALLIPLFVIAGFSSVPVLYVVAAAAITLPAAWGLMTWLTRPLYRLMDKTRINIGNKNYRLAKYIYTGRMDEFGTLELALLVANWEARAITARVDDSAEIVLESTSDLTRNMELTNNAISRLHEETDMVTTGMNGLSNSAQEVAQNANTAAEAATTARQEARNSNIVVNDTVDSINHLAEEVGNAAGVIEELENESQIIGNVVNVIRDITEQTNLLALNAAIEAARAGEHGRGFAVVADEVRTLAQRTQGSTEEIKTIIEKLQQQTKNAVNVMNEGRVKAEHSVELASKAGESLVAIDSAVQTVTDMVQQIAMATENQTNVTSDINNNIISINEHAMSVLRESEKVNASSKGLEEQALRLEELAYQFKKRANKLN